MSTATPASPPPALTPESVRERLASLGVVTGEAADQFLFKKDLNHVLEGAIFYGSGGGGGRAMARQYLDAVGDGFAYVVSPDSVVGSTQAVVGCGIGEPSTTLSGGALTAPRRAVEMVMQSLEPDYQSLVLGGVESGAVSMMIAALVASQMIKEGKLAILMDADGAGRAMPEMTMLRYNELLPGAVGVPVSPLALVNNAGDFNKLVTGMTSATEAEAYIRPLIGPNGGMLSMGCWPGSAEQYKQLLVHNTFTRCMELSKLFESKPNLQQVLDKVGGTVLFRGYCTGVQSVASGGFDHGTTSFAREQDGIPLFFVQNMNENIMANYEGVDHPVAMGPDLISFYDLTACEAFSNVEVSDYCGKKADGSRGSKWQHEVAIIWSPADKGIWQRTDIISAWRQMARNTFFYYGSIGPTKPEDVAKRVQEHAKIADAIAAQRSGAVAPAPAQ